MTFKKGDVLVLLILGKEEKYTSLQDGDTNDPERYIHVSSKYGQTHFRARLIKEVRPKETHPERYL